MPCRTTTRPAKIGKPPKTKPLSSEIAAMATAPRAIIAAPIATSTTTRRLTDGSCPAIRISLRLHEGEQDDVADRGLPGEQHDEAVDADALPGRRRHADLERAAVVLVVVHRLGGAGRARAQLGL